MNENIDPVFRPLMNTITRGMQSQQHQFEDAVKMFDETFADLKAERALNKELKHGFDMITQEIEAEQDHRVAVERISKIIEAILGKRSAVKP